MNDLTYVQKGVFGNADFLQNLAFAEKAVLLLLSDTHGDFHSIINIIKHFGEKTDAVLFSGDGLKDFIHVINLSVYDDELRNSLPPLICLVEGNSDEMHLISNLEQKNSTFTNKPEFEKSLCLTVCGTKILLTHGHEFFVDYEFNTLASYAKKNGCSIAIYGHTHFPLAEEINGILLINPGSTSKPRRGAKKSFALLTAGKSINPKVQFIETASLTG